MGGRVTPDGAAARRDASVASREVHLLTRLRRIHGWRRYALMLGLDAAIASFSLYLGFLLRFEGAIPPERIEQFWRCLPVLLSSRLPLHVIFGIHHWSFRLSGFDEAMRVVRASLAGTGLFVTVFYSLQKATEDVSLGPPRSVVAIEFLLTTALLGALRFSPRFAFAWSLDRSRARAGAVRAVIVGAGSAGDLLLRDLKRSDEHAYDVLGFVDDDPAKLWTSLGGKPVLGPIDCLPDVVRSKDVREVLLAIPRMPAGRLRQILTLCQDLKLSYRSLPVSFAYLNDRVSASMLQALAPEDLLQRPQVTFDHEEVKGLICGRRVMVSGAGGSIGGEICRQVAKHGPASLALLDVNENDQYLLARDLERLFPHLALTVEIATVRERGRLERLGRKHRPEVIFHAAAHKHVPLMEAAPEEAVLTNVVGCLNLGRVAQEIGSKRFVLISTDKAVSPSNVMGASKALAEQIVSGLAATGDKDCFCAVRFGNVLASSGSVVPLFKAQIAAGGPVTVTHPEIRRYLMTIREAVGLTLVAGLLAPGDLCVLEMGEPIRILDLARLMITLAGYVPEEEIPIVFTGLRPGERLEERLMTDAERRRSRPFKDMIRVIDTIVPPADLFERIARMEALAVAGEREALLREMGELLPSYGAVEVPTSAA